MKIKCSKCGQIVDKESEICSYCGEKLKSNKVNIITTIVIVVALLLVLIAISVSVLLPSKDDGEKNSTTEQTQSTEENKSDDENNAETTNNSENETAEEDLFAGMNTYVEGQYKVGVDIPSGEYVLFSDDGGYFNVSSDANGNNTIFNGNFETASTIQIKDGEYVEFRFCTAIETKEFHKKYNIPTEYQGVLLKVGVDIEPGEYKLVSKSDGGYYCVYKTARHNDIVTNSNFGATSYVKVEKGQYLELSYCTIEKK